MDIIFNEPPPRTTLRRIKKKPFKPPHAAQDVTDSKPSHNNKKKSKSFSSSKSWELWAAGILVVVIATFIQSRYNDDDATFTLDGSGYRGGGGMDEETRKSSSRRSSTPSATLDFVPLRGTGWDVVQKITGPQNRSQFGFAIDWLDDLMVVGMPGLDRNQGAIQTYQSMSSAFGTGWNKKSKRTWTEAGPQLEGMVKDESYGRSLQLAMRGSSSSEGKSSQPHLVVGGLGRANFWKWRHKDTEWLQIGEDMKEGRGSKAYGFGYQVGLGGGNEGERRHLHLAISAPGSGRDRQGHVTAYLDGDTIMRILGPPTKRTEMGSTLAMSRNGRILAIGAPTASKQGMQEGQVRLYKWSWNLQDMGEDETQPWTSIGRVLHGKEENEWLGQGLALNHDGSVIAVGSPGRNTEDALDTGMVRIMRWNAEQEKYVPLGQRLFGTSEGEQFGFSVALNEAGNVLAVGGVWKSKRTGFVQVYQYDDDSTEWHQIGQDLDGEQEGDWFGQSVALSSTGSELAVGAICRNNGLEGYVKLFQLK